MNYKRRCEKLSKLLKKIDKLEQKAKNLKKILKVSAPVSFIAGPSSYFLNRELAKNAFLRDHNAEYQQAITNGLTPIVDQTNINYNLTLTPNLNVTDQISTLYDNNWVTTLNGTQFYQITMRPGFESFYRDFGNIAAQLHGSIQNITNNFINWDIVNTQALWNTVGTTLVVVFLGIGVPLIMGYLTKRKIEELKLNYNNIEFDMENETAQKEN